MREKTGFSNGSPFLKKTNISGNKFLQNEHKRMQELEKFSCLLCRKSAYERTTSQVSKCNLRD